MWWTIMVRAVGTCCHLGPEALAWLPPGDANLGAEVVQVCLLWPRTVQGSPRVGAQRQPPGPSHQPAQPRRRLPERVWAQVTARQGLGGR